ARWCERSAFASRCAAYCVEVATAMCGDFREGLELAVGRPHPVDDEVSGQAPAWHAELQSVQLSSKDEAELERQQAARKRRVGATPLSKMAWAYAMLSHRWATEWYDRVQGTSDIVLDDALEVVMRDSTFITVKLHRALDGRDRYQHDERGDDPVQNDWNGSAKVALISLERSEAAWRV